MTKLDKAIKEVKEHTSGRGCECGAWYYGECSCGNAEWRSKREVALETALNYLLNELKQDREADMRLPELISETEQILNAKR
jgi:hypothetical protein